MSERKTLGQYAAAAGDDPWACRSCGCRHWEVADSRLAGDFRKRERRCRNCKEPMRTYEVPVPEGFTLKVVPDVEVA